MLELTKSNEDYLEAIGLLSEKNGTAQVRDIAEMLKVKMPSVTSAVKQLAGGVYAVCSRQADSPRPQNCRENYCQPRYSV